jgi:hypothetical protein
MEGIMKFILWIAIIALYPLSEIVAQQQATIDLGGYQQVPPVRSSGSGTLTVTLHADTLFVEGSFQDLIGQYRTAAIHYGSSRESGNRLLALKVTIGDDHLSGEFKREDNAFVLRPSLLEALEQGNLYINIATRRNMTGEIRGQIPPMKMEVAETGGL